jgi:prepilin-type N-terminal cleavage/methylation domain-containing protein
MSDRRAGFTLLETMIALVILVVVIGVAMHVSLESSRLFSDSDVTFTLRRESEQAFRRLRQCLRESGWSTLGGVLYPRVLESGTVLEFRALVDADGNGAPFDESTGEHEWSSNVFRVRRDAVSRMLWVDSVSGHVWPLARDVESVAFATHIENTTLQLPEVRFSIQTSKTIAGGEELSHSFTGVIRMRN